MMNWGKIFKPMVFCCALTSAGCLPEANYPDEPIVEFVSFEVDDLGSGSLIFNVTDGDGDLV